MFDVISPFINLLWPVIVAIAGILGVFVYGKRKKAEGRKLERRRAEEARADAKANAEVVREKSAKKPVEQKRKDLGKWER